MTATDLDTIQLPTEAAYADQTDIVALLDRAIVAADERRAELAEAGDLDALAHGLVAIRDLSSKLRILIGQIDGDVSRLNNERGRDPYTIDGLGTLETKRKSARTRWDSELLFGRLVDRICAEGFVDPHTGQMIGDSATAERIGNLLRDRLAAAVPLTPSMGWRIGGLKAAGIDPEDYREREMGDYTTRVITPDGAK